MHYNTTLKLNTISLIWFHQISPRGYPFYMEVKKTQLLPNNLYM